MTSPAVQVTGATKAFGRAEVLSGVDLEVPRGDLAAVLGPSGCGKTTLLRLIAGFEHLDAGRIVVGDQPVAGDGLHVPPERRRVGIVPQEGALFPHLDVAANVGYGLPRADRGRRVAEVLELVGLGGYQKRMPHELSGGQQQRIAVARALAPAPSVVLLDEPFSALDSALRLSVRTEVRAALRLAGATAVLVTHDQQEALSIADRVAVLRDGRIVQCGTPQEVYGAPVDLGVATFVGEGVVVPGIRSGGVVRTPFGELPAAGPAGDGEYPVDVVLRPEQLEIGPVSDEATAAVIVERTFFGSHTHVRVRLPGAGFALVRTDHAGGLDVGRLVTVRSREGVLCYPQVTRMATSPPAGGEPGNRA